MYLPDQGILANPNFGPVNPGCGILAIASLYNSGLGIAAARRWNRADPGLDAGETKALDAIADGAPAKTRRDSPRWQ
jgi:hypothetical protein